MTKPLPRWRSATSIGFGFWLFFLFALVLMGHSVFLALTLGALGGIAAGWSMSWLNNPDPEPPQHRWGKHRRLDRTTTHSGVPGIEAAQRQRRIREQRSPKGRIKLPFSRLFRRGRRR
ncbi:MAG: hypothetical protein HC910_03785 [Spirulinaceae cyanobacterium SM2_1_0]|nr:hypothetical protein [Spirulinaceae cyanobacterium SM2_1_0]